MAQVEVCKNPIFEGVERCMSVMQSGTQMVKLKAGSKGLVRLFYLDDHRSCIRWKPSRKSEKAKITIDSLYKVTEGRQSDIFHRHAEGSFDPACCFTVYHGNHMESLDLVTSSPEETRTWLTGLRYLMAGISDEDSLAKRQRTHDQWMRQTFEEADKNGDGLLNMEEIHQLLHKMNVNLPRRKVKQLFQEADSDEQQGTLTYEEYSVFYKMISLRRDLFLLLMAYSDRKDNLTAEELANFLRTEQKMSGVTTEYCLDVIEKFEASDENKQKGILSIDGFTSFMRSPMCDVLNPEHLQVNQDMQQSLSSYYIASSHNTYLTGDQLLSHSKTDMYAWVLQAGCRCVEVDCWDGSDGEPMVQHGYTLTSKITFKSVIETINKYAFVNNPFPVILSIENHCSVQQQKKIAQHLREILTDKLDLGDTLQKDARLLPSPHSLQGKILIKGKRLPPYLSADVEEGEVSDDDSADEMEDDYKLKNSNSNGLLQMEGHMRKKLDSLLREAQIGDKEDGDSFSIRALLRATHGGLHKNLRPSSKAPLKKSQSRSFISTLKQKRHSKSRLKCQSEEGEEDGQETSGREAGGQLIRGGRKRKTIKLSRDLSDLVVFTNSVASQDSLDEGTPGDVLSFSETRAQSLISHRAENLLCFNQRQLSRIYPSAYRIDSSNFNPQLYWNTGCQLVALNYQTEGRMMQLNRSKFLVNGNSGYVLKPATMCNGSFNPCSDDPLPACPKKQLILKIISGQQLPKPPDSMLGDRGEIIDPFVEVEIIGLPVDCCKEQTRVVDDNGFNPVWEETLSFTLHMADIAMVRFLVWDHDPIGRDFVGQRTIAFSSLMPGYRHVYLEGLTEASIFIHVSVHEIHGKWSPLVLNPSFTIMHFLGSNKGRQLRGFRGLFNRTSKSSVDTHSSSTPRKRSLSDQLLRRTASAPAKGRKKTKMVLAESSSCIADRKDRKGSSSSSASDRKGSGTSCVSDRRDRKGSAGAGGEAAWVERRALPPRPSLTHRPLSMPLEKMLQGQLSLRSPSQEHPDLGIDTAIGTGPVDWPRSASLDLIIQSSVSTPSTHPTDRTGEADQSDVISYLVIGGEAGRSEGEERVLNGPTRDEDLCSPQRKLRIHSDLAKTDSSHVFSPPPETDHSSTLRTAAPPPSSCSAPPRSPVNVDRSDLRSPASLQDSALSRLIDAVSIGNDNSTCGSISALIGQFDLTADRSDLAMTTINGRNPGRHVFGIPSPPPHPLPLHLHGFQGSSTPTQTPPDPPLPRRTPGNPLSPHKANKTSSYTDKLTGCFSPQKTALSPSQPPLAASPGNPPPLFSSPETTEQEEVYTILDEEVLSPVSVYNLREQTIRNIKADSAESTPPASLEPSPIRVPPPSGTEAWGSSPTWRGVPKETGESYLDGCEDAGLEREWGVTWSHTRPSVNGNHFLLCQDSAGSSLMEVEVNVDEDPSEAAVASPRHAPTWRHSSPTKRHAIYQQSRSNPDLPHQGQLPLRYAPQTQRPFCPSPLSLPSLQPSPGHAQLAYQPSPGHAPLATQPSAFRRPRAPRPTNPSPLCRTSCPSPHDRAEMTNGGREFGRTLSQPHSYNPGEESLSRERGLYSPSSDSDLTHSQTDYGCVPSPSAYTQPPTQAYSPADKQPHPLPQTHMGPSLTPSPQPGPPMASSPCKSKSLGDLTSEDISCNFQSRYHIISRSFITPSMRERRRGGPLGGLNKRPPSADSLTEQLRRLVSLEDSDKPSQPPRLPQSLPQLLPPWHQPQSQSHPQSHPPPPISPPDPEVEDSPPPLSRRLSSRSQSRVRHINSRARERQQEALKPRGGTLNGAPCSMGGVVLRNKPASQNPPVNRHSTGSYIGGYLDHLEARGLPEGACTSMRYGYGDHYGDQYYTDDSLLTSDSPCSSSEPEVYFLLRL